MNEAGVWDYNRKRQRFKRHTDVARTIMQFKVDCLKTVENGETCAVQINELINSREVAKVVEPRTKAMNQQ